MLPTDNFIRSDDKCILMTVNEELLRRLYPEWYPQDSIHPLIYIFLAIFILLLIPFLISKLICPMLLEDRFAALWKKIRPPRPHMNQLLSI